MARGRKDYEKAVIAVESEGYQDLHGRILMQDNFEDTPFKWVAWGDGIWFVSRQARAAYNSSFGAELDITSNAPPISRFANMARYVPIDVTRRLRFETFWRANVIDRINLFSILIEFYDGDAYHRIVLQYDRANTIWEYMNDLGGMVALPGSLQTFRDDAWNELTLSIDLAVDEYITFKSNNIEINMGGILCRSLADPTGAHARIWIYASNRTADQLLISIDDTVLKELEV